MKITRQSEKNRSINKEIFLSIILPVFNEQDVIGLMLNALDEMLGSHKFKNEVLVVDDGSTDLTSAIVLQYVPINFTVRLISMIGNQGHMMALTAGLEAAHGKWIASMDADFQDPPEVLHEMILKLSEGRYDVVQAVRRARDVDSVFKRSSATLFYKWMKFLLPANSVPQSADFRIISAEMRDLLVALPERSRIYRLLIPAFNFNIATVKFDRDIRKAGKTKYPLSKMIKLALDSTFAFSAKPLHLLFVFGLGSSFIMILASFAVLFSKFFISQVSGWTSIVLLILSVNSLILAGLGLVGEYIARIYQEVQNRPVALWEEN